MDKKESHTEKLFWLKRKKFIRLLSWPFINIKRFATRIIFCFSDDYRKLKEFKGIHDGERCFIIGNGPSLRPEDLDKIKNEYTFATNRIYYIFSKTEWRPTYYFCSDASVLRIEQNKTTNVGTECSFLSVLAKKYFGNHPGNVVYFAEKFHHYINSYHPQPFQISEDVSKYFYVSGSVTTHAIQMAIYMGFKEIILLGVDHNYSVQLDANGNVIRNKEAKNHFSLSKEYSFEMYNYGSVEYAFRITKEYCDNHGIKIYNATRGGKLEVFERKKLEEVM